MSNVNSIPVARPLVWYLNDATAAETPFGLYEFGQWQRGSDAIVLVFGGSEISEHQSIQAAKSAAQSDYEARIRSALAAPSVAETAEPVEELQWREGSVADRYIADADGRPMYEVGFDNGRWYWMHNWQGLAKSGAASEEAAKAAAQAHYETRTHPSPSPVAPSGLEALDDGPSKREGEAIMAEAAAIERAETAERDLSAALARNAEIEGETIERCAKIAGSYAFISAAIRSSATKQEKADG